MDPTDFAETLGFAILGILSAQTIVGLAYLHGTGVEQSEHEGVKWLTKAANQNEPLALYELGNLYALGKYYTKNIVEAVKLWTRAAELHNADAQLNIGYCYNKGNGVEKNINTALHWWERAANQNHAIAQFELGSYYFNERNYARAITELTRSAINGYAKAQHQLGIIFYQGYGTDKNEKEGIRLFQLAADQGFALSEAIIAQFLFYGDGMEKDLKAAYKYMKKAASKGNALAQSMMPKIMASMELRTCANCNKVEPSFGTFKCCNGCKVPRYCSVECQKEHWKSTHKPECKKINSK